MAQKAETVFRARVIKHFKAIPFSWWESIQQKCIVGTPDTIGTVKGKFVALEFKKDKTAHRSPMQRYKRKLILEAQGIHFWVYPENYEEVLNQLRRI